MYISLKTVMGYCSTFLTSQESKVHTQKHNLQVFVKMYIHLLSFYHCFHLSAVKCNGY